MKESSGERVEVFDHGSYIIDPTSKSLIIPNANEALLAGEYVCEDNNTQCAAIAPRLVWAEQHQHISVYNLPVPGLPP